MVFLAVRACFLCYHICPIMLSGSVAGLNYRYAPCPKIVAQLITKMFKLYMLIFPIVCALIGWFTNYLAVRMLFRPHEPVNFGLFKVQGLIPKRRKDVAGNIAKTVEKELLSVDDITGVLQRNIDWQENIDKKIDHIVEEKLRIEMWQKLPFWDSFRDKIALPLKAFLSKEIAKIIKNFQNELVVRFRKNLDLHKLVYDRIDRFDLQQLEDVVLKIASRELRHIELLGGLLGFIIGLIQVLIMMAFQ